MKIKNLHCWDLSLGEAIKLQQELNKKIVLEPPFNSVKEIKTVAGTDVHFSQDELVAYAGIVIVSFPELKILEKVKIEKYIQPNKAKTKVNQPFPYIPGLLSFREIPVLLLAFKKMKTNPDVILCDGQGIAHPRRMGLATHLGIILNKPTIGCAKSLLYGKYEKLPDRFKGSYTYLHEKGKIIGAVLRSKEGVRPVFVSPGHKINLRLAIEIVLRCCTKYRLPEPLRFAHQITQMNVRDIVILK